MIPGMPSVGGGELLIILVIVLLLFGAKRLPELGRSLGQSIREFRSAFSNEDDKDQGQIRNEAPREESSLNRSSASSQGHRKKEKITSTEQNL
jgi:sec-independent protein translocase protein TatA